VAGTYVVQGAVGLGTHFGLDPFLLGAVLVAFGTSTPELATTVVAKLRGHDEIALGTLLGSNIFNIALVAPTAALIHPIQIDRAEVGLALGFGLALAVTLVPPASNRLGRNRGLLMLVLYGTYLWTLTALGLAH